ncbi:MAG: dihydropyrimidinase [Albidovulum sp.]|uniref:dihydropyrimidinase n=1 Tax=Albidovulum sp. TaxID=1872424 RepID=UPI003C7FA74F
MPDFDLVIRGGHLVGTEREGMADLGIRGGKIVAIGEGLARGADEIDATGRLVLPGGIDSHCHIEQVTSTGLCTFDTFRSATRAAAAGGTTTVIPFACQRRGQSPAEVLAAYRRLADGQAEIDYAFHLILTDPDATALASLPVLAGQGYTSLKIYMTYEALKLDDRQILDVLDLARREGLMVMVHAEGHDMIRWLTERLIASGRTAPRYHTVARHPLAEREATHRAVTLAELIGAQVLIVHVSGRGALDEIARARAAGKAIHAETCPQYLLLTAADLDRPGFEGAKCLCSPPPRDAAQHARVWQALARGEIDVLSSDHSAFAYSGPDGKQANGSSVPFNEIPQGVPGIELRMPLLFSEGVVQGRLSLRRFVQLTAENHARLYGLWPRKGSIAVGADADVAIWNPTLIRLVTPAILHDGMDYTPYEGREVTGWPETVLSRGVPVFRDGSPAAPAGHGTFLPCDRPFPRGRGDTIDRLVAEIFPDDGTGDAR